MSDLSTLLPVSPCVVGGAEIHSVDARRLHAFLGVGKVFGAWIAERIEGYGFQEHRDFEVFSEIGNNPQGGRPAKEYALALDMAKELAMVERNEKGRQARAYFLECERRAQDPVHALLAMSRPEMLEMAARMAREKEALRLQTQAQQQTISALAPKAAFHDEVAQAEGGQSLGEVAKVLGTGQNRLFAWLRAQHILMADNRPYQEYLERGYFRLIEQAWKDREGEAHLSTKTLITGKGLIWLQRRWAEAAA